MSAVDEGNVDWGVLKWRVGKNEERIGKLDDWRRIVDSERATMKEIVTQTSKDVATVDTKLDGLRSMIITACLTVTGSVIVLSVSILLATGRIHG